MSIVMWMMVIMTFAFELRSVLPLTRWWVGV
jgi:hypothetical protein